MKKIGIIVFTFLVIILSASKCEYTCEKLVSINNFCNRVYEVQIFQDIAGAQKLMYQVETNNNISILKKKKDQKAMIIYFVNGEDSKKNRISSSDIQNTSFKIVINKIDTTTLYLDFTKEFVPIIINICDSSQ